MLATSLRAWRWRTALVRWRRCLAGQLLLAGEGGREGGKEEGRELAFARASARA
jgi:hypothetical protein